MTVDVGTDARRLLLDGVDVFSIADSIPHMVWLAAPDGSTEYLNDCAALYTGREADLRRGWNWIGLFHPDDAERGERAWAGACSSKAPYELDCRIRRHDGVYRWHTFRSFPVRDDSGSLNGWIGTATDIDDRMRFEEQLQRSERSAAETMTLLETLQSTAPVGFGFVDRDFRIVRINEMLASVNGSSVEEHLGHTVAEVVPAIWPKIAPVCRSVLDTGVAVLNVETGGQTAAEPGREHHWLGSFYPVRLGGEIIGVGVVVVDITERYEAEAARNELTHSAVAAIAATIDARDPYTAGHQRRVADIAAAIASELGVTDEEIEGIEIAATIHDVGKIGVPAEILTRPGRLRSEEQALLRTHPRIGFEIVAGIDFPWPVARMILQHHERVDGSGYPDGLAGDEILLGARIIAVADTVEAMSADRPYRFALGLEAALEELRDGRGALYDRDVVDACLLLARRGRLPIGELGRSR